jgi:RNA polymerase nonessential primary-like sigma factor
MKPSKKAIPESQRRRRREAWTKSPTNGSAVVDRKMPGPDFVTVPSRGAENVAAVLAAAAAIVEASIYVLPRAELERRTRAARLATARVVAGNQGLVVIAARKYGGHAKSLEFEDVVQAGNMGLLRAIELFDPAKGAWSTFAFPWVRQAVTRAVHDLDDVVRKPVHIHETRLKARRRAAKLEAQLGRPPTDAELAQASGRTIRQLRAAFDPSAGAAFSLDADLGLGPDPVTRHDFLVAHGESPLHALERVQREELTEALLEKLTDRQRLVLRERYVEGKTLDEIGAREGVTRERIRQIENKALSRLRTFVRYMRVGADDVM